MNQILHNSILKSKFRRKNGRFISKKKAENIVKSVAAKKEKKKAVDTLSKGTQPENESRSIIKGQRVISVAHLAKHLKCKKCFTLLDLEKISKERRTGFHSDFFIECVNCQVMNIVPTGVTEKDFSHNNASMILGKFSVNTNKFFLFSTSR